MPFQPFLISKQKQFTNGIVYGLRTADGYPIEVTDTFLPCYTKDAVGRRQNKLTGVGVGDRYERWMVGVSVMSGCPVRCKFCATGQLKKWRSLTAQEIAAQVQFILERNLRYDPAKSYEFKVNYTRMGEPFLNIEEVIQAIHLIDELLPNVDVHHYISTIGIVGSDFDWIADNVTLQLSLHSLDPERRNWLIPYKKKLTIPELGDVRTYSDLKTTLNLTLVEEADFDIVRLQKFFPPEHFFVKLSPINPNETSERHGLGTGVIDEVNLH